MREEGDLNSPLPPIDTPTLEVGDISALLYPTIFEKAAQLLYGLNKNHGFIDGNKRIAIHAMLVYLIINDIEIEYTQEDIVSLSIAVADDKANPADIVEWIENRVIKKPLDDLNRSFL